MANPYISKYDTMVKPYLDKVEEMARTMTDEQIARSLGVGKSSFSTYKKNQPELLESLKKGRQNLVSDLRSALIMKAVGFTKTTKKAMKCKVVDYDPQTGKRLQEREDLVEYEQEDYFPPDTAALNLALKNYDKEKWANDPQMLDVRKKELKLKEKQIEQNDW